MDSGLWIGVVSVTTATAVATLWYVVRLAQRVSLGGDDRAERGIVRQLLKENEELRRDVDELKAWKAQAEAIIAQQQRTETELRATINWLLALAPRASSASGPVHYTAPITLGLRALLVDRFSAEELRVLAHDAGFGDDAVVGESKIARADNLISYAERRSMLAALVAAVERARPGSTKEADA